MKRVLLLVLLACWPAWAARDELQDVRIQGEYKLSFGDTDLYYMRYEADSGDLEWYDAADNKLMYLSDEGTTGKLVVGTFDTSDPYAGLAGFDLDADTGTAETVADGDTVTIAGSTYIDTAVSATDTVTVSLDLSAGLTIPDDQYLKVGTDNDIYYGYDETTDDRAEWTDGTNLLMYLADVGTTGNFGVTGALAANTLGVYSGTTATLFNATATTVNAFGAATTLNIGNAGGTNTVLGTSNFTRINTTGGVHVGGTSDPGTDNLIVDGTSTLTGAVTTGSTLQVNGATSTTGNGTSSAIIVANGAAGSSRNFRMQTNGSLRWLLGATNSAESGSNSGSNFELQAWSDAGAYIDSPIAITRAAGGTFLTSRPFRTTSTLDVDSTLTLGSGNNVVSTSAGLIDDTKIDPGSAGQVLATGVGGTASAWETIATKPIILTAVGGEPAITSGCGAVVNAATPSNAVNYHYLPFDDTTQELCWWEFVMPKDYKPGSNLSFKFQWMADTSATDSVVWAIELYQRIDGQAVDAIVTTSASVTDANTGQLYQNISAEGTITGTSLVAGAVIRARVYRHTGSGSDTLTGDAWLNFVKMEYQPLAYL